MRNLILVMALIISLTSAQEKMTDDTMMVTDTVEIVKLEQTKGKFTQETIT